MPFHIATPDEIKSGRVTDVYFRRTLEILEAKGIDVHVRAEFIAKSLPDAGSWGVFAGLEEFLHLFEGTEVDIRAMEEGEIFRPLQPVAEIAGRYRDFATFETAALGLICQASGIATRAAGCRVAAGGDVQVVSFGARRMHPALAPMIERAAYIGGCDGVAVVKSAELLGIDPLGTMPHALILTIGDTLSAALAFDELIDRKVPRIILIDTISDEKTEALRIAEALGDRLDAVRIDTPGSRRGDLKEILSEIRWEFDLRGYNDVELFVSGGIDAQAILELKTIADGFGVGTYISGAPVIDYAMDIVEIDGVPVAKRGKRSGAKQVLRYARDNEDVIVPLADRAGWKTARPDAGGFTELLQTRMKGGQPVEGTPAPREIRENLIGKLAHLGTT